MYQTLKTLLMVIWFICILQPKGGIEKYISYNENWKVGPSKFKSQLEHGQLTPYWSYRPTVKQWNAQFFYSHEGRYLFDSLRKHRRAILKLIDV